MKSIIVCLIMLAGACCFAAESDYVALEQETVSSTVTYESFDSMFTLYQPYLTNLGPYKPIYFLMGADPKDSRFQISLKYQPFSDATPIGAANPWVTGIQLGFTQTSSWDLRSDSAPFEDTSYEPELFYFSRNVSGRPRWLKGLFYQLGVLHESNGRGEDLSRNTNRIYFRPIAIWYNSDTQLGLQLSPKLWMNFNNSDSNPDLADYRGYFELELKAGKQDGFVFGSSTRWASEGASVQLDLTYPLSLGFFKNLEFYFQAQYVNTLAETLLDYKKRTEAVRIGFSLLR